MVERTRGDDGMELHRLWKARSQVTLQPDVEEPDLDNDGKLRGELLFTLSLWAPDEATVRADAMQDAIAWMAEELGEEFTIPRGVVQ